VPARAIAASRRRLAAQRPGAGQTRAIENLAQENDISPRAGRQALNLKHS
jgi:hypothetical protein